MVEAKGFMNSMEKQLVRSLIRKVTYMNEKEYMNCSNAILQNIIEVPEFQHAQKVFIFISKYPEPFTRDIIAFCYMARKEVYVPILRDGEMLLTRYYPTDELKIVEFGLKEPVDAVAVDVLPDMHDCTGPFSLVHQQWLSHNQFHYPHIPLPPERHNDYLIVFL